MKAKKEQITELTDHLINQASAIREGIRYGLWTDEELHAKALLFADNADTLREWTKADGDA
jgi:hypothetical protein